MKPNRIAILFAYLFPLFASYGQPTTPIDLSSGWKWQTGDNARFAETGFDDQSWKTINVGASWESQGVPDYNGIAWYRNRVLIPSSLKTSNPYLKGILLTLGRIDDADHTFVNGTEIGHTDGNTINRQYMIPFDLIRWDQPNVLAIRVEDKTGNGGLLKGPYKAGVAVKLPMIIALKLADKPTFISASGPDALTKTVTLTTTMPVDKLSGTLSINVYNAATKKVVFQQVKPVTLGTAGSLAVPFSVTVSEAGSYRADYTFRNQAATDSLTRSTLVGYSAAPRTSEHLTEPIVAQKIPDKAFSFPLEDIRFSGFLEDRLTANLTQRLLNIDETGILEGFYNRPGKQTWVGEYPGKYLHAASRVWRYSRNPALKKQMDRIVDVLIATQLNDGYLGTYLPAQYWTDWDVWAHKYDMLGLLSYYAATGYKPALETSRRIGDLLCRTFGNGPGQRNIMLSGHHVGMASGSVLEPMTDLYRFTGDKRYLDFCNYTQANLDFD